MDANRVTPGKAIHATIWDRVAAISSLTLAVVGLAALIFTWRQIHEMRDEARVQIGEMREESKVQHLTAFIDKFDSSDQTSMRRALAQKRVNKKLERLQELDTEAPPAELDAELQFCDNIGLLTERGYLDRHDVWEAFGQWLFYLYADARPYLDGLRNPADYRACMNLVESIRPIEAKEDQSGNDHPSENDLYNSYIADIELQAGQPAFRGRAPKKP